MDWDDLRIIAAIRDSGTFAGAGIRLGIDETTISRRLARLQKTLGVTLFEAIDGVRKPTAHCESILDHVQEMARHVAEIGALGETRRAALPDISVLPPPIRWPRKFWHRSRRSSSCAIPA
jgi:DNA-binding transcriptional LysR family regulator